MAQLPRGTRSRLRPIDLCLNRSFRVGRPQPHSRSPWSLRKARGLAEQGQSTSRAGSKSPPSYCFGRARRAPERSNLKAAFLLQLSHEPVIDQIFRLEAADLFAHGSQEPNQITNAFGIGIDAPFVKGDQAVVALRRVLDPRQAKTSGETFHHQGSISGLLDKGDRLHQGPQNILHDIRGRCDEAAPRYDPRPLIRNRELGEVREERITPAREHGGERIAQLSPIYSLRHDRLGPHRVVADDPYGDPVPLGIEPPVLERQHCEDPTPPAGAAYTERLSF